MPGKPSTKEQPVARQGEIAEALRILERIENELPAVEQRTERLMHHYGLSSFHGGGKLTATPEVQKTRP